MIAEQQRGVLGEQSADPEKMNDPIRIGVCLPVAPGGARRVERLICDRRLYDGDPRISRWWRDIALMFSERVP